MWREARIAFSDSVGALNCSVIPVHPWLYGVGQQTENGAYLSPVNAINYLAEKLAGTGGASDIVIMMVSGQTHDSFMASLDNDSGMFQFPPEGTLVEIAFTGGRPDKPFVRQTVPDGTSLPDIQPGEQLQQQRAEVSQRVTQAGDWVRQTDQTISETSMARMVKADTELRELVSRETTVKATDKITVLGTSTLMAGAIQQVCTGDYSQAVNNRVASIGGNDETDIAGSQSVTTGKDLIEKIGQIRKSVAAVQQQIIAPVVWIGSGTINVAQLMLDTLDVVKELAEQTASHTHSNTGAPTNAGAIRNTGAKADTLNGKYSPVIGQ
ncbi:hypothetical protein HCO69_09985 [Pantoea sp. LS15]|uniref:hypothetical protein n=1 Tax=Enterobacter sp. 9-2 TaxID=559106 RepID=UPI001438D753|nr:hypothetical protein [Pantoea sp. LS15]NJQ19958.1 hypothetical protein [Pantoea sp. LS15]NKF46554.1 hypothetical protein [Pantoea sp. LS15]